MAKRNYIRINRNIMASWVFADPQYFHVLTYLILQADPETGVVKNSQVDMAKYLRIPRATLQRIIAKLEDKGTVKTLKVGKQIGSITICNYARYQGLGKSTRASKNATTKERTEEEKKSLPPHPLIEEKKEKRKKDPAVAVNFSNVKLTHTIGGASLSSKMPAAAPTFNDRRQAFWYECQRYATRYSEEMLRNFFLYWTETNSRKPDKMRFEKEKTFQVGLRLQKWKHNGDVFGEDRAAQRRKQPATEQLTTLSAKETATMEARFENQQQREAQWEERRRKAVTYEEYQRMKAEGKVK